MNEWWMMLSRYSKFLFRRWLISMLTSVSFWKIAAMLVQSSTTFRGGGWGVSSLILCTHRDSVSRISLLWVFVSSLTDIIFVLKYSAHIQTSTSPPPLQWPPVLAFLSTRKIVIHARWERMTWRNWYDKQWEGWDGGKGMHSNFEKFPPVTVVSSPCQEPPGNYLCQHGGLWFMRGGRGWHGGIGMNNEKDGMMEKAWKVWSALGRELRLCLEITKVIRTITESMCRRSNETKLLLFSVQA